MSWVCVYGLGMVFDAQLLLDIYELCGSPGGPLVDHLWGPGTFRPGCYFVCRNLIIAYQRAMVYCWLGKGYVSVVPPLGSGPMFRLGLGFECQWVCTSCPMVVVYIVIWSTWLHSLLDLFLLLFFFLGILLKWDKFKYFNVMRFIEVMWHGVVFLFTQFMCGSEGSDSLANVHLMAFCTFDCVDHVIISAC